MMMISAAFLLASNAVGLIQSDQLTPAGYLRELCVATAMQRAGYESFAASRGWQKLLRVVRADEPLDTRVWESMYGLRAGGVQSWMSGETGGEDPSQATSCGIAVTELNGEWRADLETLASELAMGSAKAVAKPNSLEARAWSTDTPNPLSLSYDLYPSGLTLRLTRSSITSAQ